MWRQEERWLTLHELGLCQVKGPQASSREDNQRQENVRSLPVREHTQAHPTYFPIRELDDWRDKRGTIVLESHARGLAIPREKAHHHSGKRQGLDQNAAKSTPHDSKLAEDAGSQEGCSNADQLGSTGDCVREKLFQPHKFKDTKHSEGWRARKLSVLVDIQTQSPWED